MNKKLIAIDLDGTTLNEQTTIDPLTIHVIQQLRKQGHIVSIVTGRPYRTSYQHYDTLGLDTPIVNFNGAWCHFPNHADWAYAYHKYLSTDLMHDLFQLKDKKEIQLISAEVGQHVYTSSPYVPYEDFFPDGSEAAEPYTKDLQAQPTAVNAFTPSKHLQHKIEKQIIKDYGDKVEIRTWGGKAPCVEIVAAGVQKAMGVEKIADYYNIPQKDIIALGDEDNDYEMIQFAGHGVAMKNAIPSIKKIANDITDYTNDEQGLARYLAKYFGIELK
ncbi:HAD family phosphatase [Dolosigranulum pigrum]|jgi:cof-like hydrolase|uniref:Cof-type HAD-IIB family hydrolase n=1 Tax=Dolosigranulum pigrum TaxID=29394 RepID=UPI000DC54DCD|nr:Cof-type HAD-IIB family hydrolase [Dolosigranulum pigrum]QJS98530.1 HAD family phosphatase [Dolosigranulum pigrum]